jgi:chaperone required for assembly of F1-ATPase
VKRFYKKVTIGNRGNKEPDESFGRSLGESGQFVIYLDDRPVRTPRKALLSIPAEALAAAIASEWESQSDSIDLDMMPLTRVAAAAVDRIIPRRSDAVDDVVRFAMSDLLCYRATTPVELVRLQSETWDPLLVWMRDSFDVDFKVTSGVMPIVEDESVFSVLSDLVGKYTDHHLAALSLAAGVSGSLVVALAITEAHLDAAAAHKVALLDDLYQERTWGEEVDARKRIDASLEDLVIAERFLSLLR